MFEHLVYNSATRTWESFGVFTTKVEAKASKEFFGAGKVVMVESK